MATGGFSWGGPADQPAWVYGHDAPLQWVVADTFRARLLGLHGWPAWGTRPRGLLLPGCGSVHTFGLRQAVDLVFFDSDGRILDVVNAVAPNGVVRCRGARDTLELPAGYGRQPGWRARCQRAASGWKMVT